MITFEGKYNFAHVFTDHVDEATSGQIIEMLNHPAFKGTQIRIMPDCHKGSGSVIGFTSTMNDYIIPNVIGVDISCAIYSFNLGNQDFDLKVLDDKIKELIPSGFSIRNNPYRKSGEISAFVEGHVYRVSQKLKLDYKKVSRSIGSLGGGNHFIELGKDQNEDTWLTIHTGSRNFGLQVANYHQKKAAELMEKMLIQDVPKGMEYLPIDVGGKEYLEDMKVAQRLAHWNRIVISNIIIEEILETSAKEEVFSVHNYIDFEDNIIRKGAIQANEGQKVVIPFNMRDGLIIGEGKGSKKWNNSAPHGAGRILSRTKAKELIKLKDFEKSMEGIYSTSVKQSTIDESPFAYKDKDEILKHIEETVDVQLFVKPIYNFKA